VTQPDHRCHPLIEGRLTSLQRALMALFDAGATMSSASRGAERELFVSSFLAQVFPPSVGFASGDITDVYQAGSGQVDIIVEAPTLFSFPAIIGGPRLYLAEGVAAVIEVKSNLSSQWDEVVAKAKAVQKLKVLERKYSPQENVALLQKLFPGQAVVSQVSPVDPVKEKKGGVPFVCVGFEGWSDVDTVRKHASRVGSVLVLRHAIYAGVGGSSKGPVGLLMFLEYLSSLIQNASATIFPTWHYGLMSQLRVEGPELFAEGEQCSSPDGGTK
jgi:hypothetical protein